MHETPPKSGGRANIPTLGAAVPRKWSALTRVIGRFFLILFGWKFLGSPPNQPKFVAIGAPHTSNWDLPLAVACIWALGIDLSWMGKHTIFKGPFGWLFEKLGGIPVDRRASLGVVGQMAAEFDQRTNFILAIAPEGTRSKVKAWKTGFYRIAEQAEVPIVPVALDYGRKIVEIGPAFIPTGDLEADLAEIKGFFEDVGGKRPSRV